MNGKGPPPRAAANVLKLLLAVALVLAGLASGMAAVAAENGVWADAFVVGGTHLGEDEFGLETASGYNGPRKLDTKTARFKLQSDHEEKALTRPENPDRTGNAQGDEERL